jgi:hypothetical protein
MPIMMDPELGEPLMLYIMATVEVVSMVLVTERPEPKQPQVLKGALTAESRSQDPDPIEGPRDQVAFRTQISEPT